MTESANLMLIWDGAALLPRTRFDARLCERFAKGAPLSATIKERRRESPNRLYWSVLQAVVDATGKWPNVEALHWALKIHLGFIDEIEAVKGQVIIRPRSIAFGRMGEEEFREFLNAAMTVLTTEVLPGMTVEDILALGKARLREVV